MLLAPPGSLAKQPASETKPQAEKRPTSTCSGLHKPGEEWLRVNASQVASLFISS